MTPSLLPNSYFLIMLAKLMVKLPRNSSKHLKGKQIVSFSLCRVQRCGSSFKSSSIKVGVVEVPDGVILPAVAFAAVAVYTFSVEQRFVFAQSPDHTPSHTHLAEHTWTIHLH